MVGARGFEPPASWSRTRRASQAALRPDATHSGVRGETPEWNTQNSIALRVSLESQGQGVARFERESARSVPKCAGRSGLYKTIPACPGRFCRDRPFLGRAAFRFLQGQSRSLPRPRRISQPPAQRIGGDGRLGRCAIVNRAKPKFSASSIVFHNQEKDANLRLQRPRWH